MRRQKGTETLIFMAAKFTAMSVFDLDHTLLKVNSSFALGQYLYRQKVFTLATMCYLVLCYGVHKSGLLSIEKLHKNIFNKFFRGKQLHFIAKHAKEYFENSLNSLFYQPATAKLQAALEQGHFVAILSSSPDFLVQLIAQKLNVHDWRGSSYLVDGSNNFSQLGDLVQGHNKAAYVRSHAAYLGIDKHNITAYSDSILDLLFLQSAGQKVAVMPDRKLRKLCHLHQWHIL